MNPYIQVDASSPIQLPKKIVICGCPYSGKTSLIRRFLCNSFVEEYSKTNSIDVIPSSIFFGEVIIHYNIWDFPNWEINKDIVNRYMSKTDAAVVVFDNSIESYQYCLKWIDVLHQVYPETRIFAIQNKNDLIKNYDNKWIIQCINELKLKEVPYYQVSSKSGYNVKNCFNEILKKLFDISTTTPLIDPLETQEVPEKKYYCKNWFCSYQQL
ncbi:Rab family GTPase [Entamoeba nuttalli P19]|uniref:Rab family GTPase n=1 Tax=Entamoeba nuttalli (strain P19) TaxID=1076696 RepID=K2GTM0_ENTNP|nr:Rab family GTPase [Entamoeba nuttalli P19]EKE37132.1 Rab family GTPase [Entamoeba nuttalli P19]|eukprot:XP_008860531.1 Rab family GTPase [Entamoeba nuttalli P19]